MQNQMELDGLPSTVIPPPAVTLTARNQHRKLTKNVKWTNRRVCSRNLKKSMNTVGYRVLGPTQLPILSGTENAQWLLVWATGKATATDWGGGMSVAAPRSLLSVSVGNGRPLLCHQSVPISCHFRDCKELSVTGHVIYVNSALATGQTFTFAIYYVSRLLQANRETFDGYQMPLQTVGSSV